MASAGAQAALRGYRLQALYTLHRVLSATEGRSFQLEGREDLEELDVSGAVVQFVQVKAYEGRDLTLSLLDPGKVDSFFRRVLARHSSRPGASELLVSFGPIGPQMLRAWAEDGDERRVVIRSLKSVGYSETEARTLLSVLRFQVADSEQIQAKVFELLRQRLTGIDPDTSFDLLHAWLFVASEAKQRVTLANLRDKMIAIGRFSQERAAYHAEWFRAVVPLVEVAEQSSLPQLQAEFYAGVSARYEHIAANLDVPRPAPLKAIDDAFALSPPRHRARRLRAGKDCSRLSLLA